MVICLERDADLHTAQLMPLPLTVSCFSKIQVGFTFLVPAHPGSPGQRAVKQVSVCVCLTTLRNDMSQGASQLHIVHVFRLLQQLQGVSHEQHFNIKQNDIFSHHKHNG